MTTARKSKAWERGYAKSRVNLGMHCPATPTHLPFTSAFSDFWLSGPTCAVDPEMENDKDCYVFVYDSAVIDGD